MPRCDVRNCRLDACIHHIPLGKWMCEKHWSEHCVKN